MSGDSEMHLHDFPSLLVGLLILLGFMRVSFLIGVEECL